MLDVSMIAPFQVFSKASKQSDFDMTLAHLFKQFKHTYIEILSQSLTRNFMLDNSFFELGKSLPLEDMFAITENICEGGYFEGGGINPFKTLILPDGDFSGFKDATKRGFTPMLVPTNDEELFIAIYMALCFEKPIKIGISCIHALKSQKVGVFGAFTRINFVEKTLSLFGEDAEKIRRGKYLHFLGLNNEPWSEIRNIAPRYNATLDSSAFSWPFIQAGLDIRDIGKKFDKPVDFMVDLLPREEDEFGEYIIEIRNELNTINEEAKNAKR